MKYLDKFASGIFSYFPEQWLTAVKLAVYSEFGFQVLATLICVYVIIYLNRHKLIDDSQPLRYRLRVSIYIFCYLYFTFFPVGLLIISVTAEKEVLD